MSSLEIRTPNEATELYPEIVPAYQVAFAGPPWDEVSKCVDTLQRCDSGFSPLEIGKLCLTCGSCPTRPAYEADELVERFDNLAATRDTAWYTERNEAGVTLAAVAWTAIAEVVAREKYVDVPAMKDWLNDQLGGQEIAWLDEVFANRELKPRGNLKNFGTMVAGLATELGQEVVAYRTIEPRMTYVAERDFGEQTKIFARGIDLPDRRDFVIIDLRGEAK